MAPPHQVSLQSFQFKPGQMVMANQMTTNINFGAGAPAMFGAGPRRQPAALAARAPRAVRVSKRKKEEKKTKKNTIKTKEGLLAEARRLEEAAKREEEEVKRKRAKAQELRMAAGEEKGGEEKEGEEKGRKEAEEAGDLNEEMKAMKMHD